MKVKELIAQLAACNQEMDVWVYFKGQADWTTQLKVRQESHAVNLVKEADKPW